MTNIRDFLCLSGTKERNFHEEFNLENGCYLHECRICKNTFLGHKYRRVCKLCLLPDTKSPKQYNSQNNPINDETY